MRLRTPRWWYRRDATAKVLSTLLAPLGSIWAKATARRLVKGSFERGGVPVICVGNLTVGGSGKTPVVMEVARLLTESGRRPAILASGHGGSIRGPIRVEPSQTATEVGDEPVMLARQFPTFISRDRAWGARAIAEAGFDTVIMDDGHQNTSLEKAFSLVVVDAETRDEEWPFGPGRALPAGPLREDLAAGVSRADAILLLRPLGEFSCSPELSGLFPPRTVWGATWGAASSPSGRRLAFAGVAKPWKVERALRTAGCELVGFEGFADHAQFTDADLGRLHHRADSQGARLVTTEKDWARLPPIWRERVESWPVSVVFDDPSGVRKALIAACALWERQAPAR